MLIKRLYLRNFRVYEDELDLDLPSGLVGVYGPNGAGKSTLLEAILFTLWGKARTTKDLIRSAGAGGDCVTEVEFEHEGHLYLVRRMLKGVNSQVSVEAHCDGQLLSTGMRDAQRYVESVLGMDDAAFRASVFTEQKQLAAFSNQSPAERRRLVLQLLGITPLDAARDSARRDARQLSADHDRLRGMLPDLDELRTSADDAAAAADAAGVTAVEEETAADAARLRADTALAAFRELDLRRQDYDALVIEGKAAAQRAERLRVDVAAKQAQMAEAETLQGRLAELEEAAAGLDEDEKVVPVLAAAARAVADLADLAGEGGSRPAGRGAGADGGDGDGAAGDGADGVGDEPPLPDHDAVRAATERAEALGRDLAAATALLRAAASDVERARRAVDHSSDLSGNAACPTCGQELGEAFAQVQSHRAAELAEAEQRRGALAADEARLQPEATAAAETAKRAAAEATRAADLHATWSKAAEQHAQAEARAAKAWQDALAAGAGRWLAGDDRWPAGADDSLGSGSGRAPTGADDSTPAGGDNRLGGRGRLASDATGALPSPAALEAALAGAERQVAAKRQAHRQALTVAGRLASRDDTAQALATAETELAEAADEVDNLRQKVKALDYRPADLDARAQARDDAGRIAQAATAAAQKAAILAAQAGERASSAAKRLEDAHAQHAKLAEIESDVRHKARAAELLSEFRNTVVASVGPRLALQAAELFGELTDHEYDRIDVDPETYELQISDGGHLYGLDRFSGSEIDLANLALRVAISEHIHFQSGGSVGLLVLDEVFGPLDDDRKGRMLLALERLRGRFRQVLVVTHDAEIKDQMPNAIEVKKLPGRRATATVL